MTIQSIRVNELDEYIKGRPREENMAVRVEIEGQIKTLHVWSIPIPRLTFNIRNGRFASELRAKEKALGRKLDPHVDADARIIRELLLDQDESETKALMDDVEKHGQIEPGIITADGAVINANRRMAVISTLHDETHEARFEYLKVARLPPNVGEKDLWRIEAGLQFAKDFRAEYGPINELLKLREGTECGLEPKDIAVSLLGRYTDKQVEGRLAVLKLIDNYLDAISRSQDYAWIGKERLMEKFNSLSDNVIEALRRKEYDPLELHRLTGAGFALINHGERSHWDIRKLAQIARHDKAKQTLLNVLPADPIKADKAELDEAFSSAVDLIDDQKEKDKPERLLNKALSALTSIDRKSPRLQSAATQALVQQVIDAGTSLLATKSA